MLGAYFVEAKRWTRRRLREASVARTPFYVRYPYDSHVSILDANPRGAVSLDRRFFYNRVPLAGNSTVCFALAKINGGTDLTPSDAKETFTRPSELSVQQVAQLEDFYKFTFVRNPYTRILSAYLSKIAKGLKAHYVGEASVSFSQFCEYLNSGGLYENAHWAPQTSLMLLPFDRYDFIGKVETFDRDWGVVFRRLAPAQADEPTVRFSRTDATSKIDEYYDDRCREIVSRLYEKDFESFEYER